MKFNFDLEPLLNPDPHGIAILKGRNMTQNPLTKTYNFEKTPTGQVYTLLNKIGEASTKVL